MPTYYELNPLTGHVELTYDFYRLGLHDKYSVIEELERLDLLTDTLLASLANAILQHSSDQAKQDYPCQSITRLPREAKVADIQHRLRQYPLLAGLSSLEQK